MLYLNSIASQIRQQRLRQNMWGSVGAGENFDVLDIFHDFRTFFGPWTTRPKRPIFFQAIWLSNDE